MSPPSTGTRGVPSEPIWETEDNVIGVSNQPLNASDEETFGVTNRLMEQTQHANNGVREHVGEAAGDRFGWERVAMFLDMTSIVVGVVIGGGLAVLLMRTSFAQVRNGRI